VKASELAILSPVLAVTYGYLLGRYGGSGLKIHFCEVAEALRIILPEAFNHDDFLQELARLGFLAFHVTSFEGQYYTLREDQL
jgi:hypothetical protein